ERERERWKERKRGREKQGWLNNETNTCIHVIGPAAGLGAAAGGRGAARVKHIVHRALHLTVVDGLTLVGAERDGDERDYTPLSKCSRGNQVKVLCLCVMSLRIAAHDASQKYSPPIVTFKPTIGFTYDTQHV
uniref:Uncharacterized protein n=1 Tax=Poecilia reticulata TaxID=8081 RepID=A0A3P9PCD7_POERE